LDRRLASMTKLPDRDELRAALERRCANWRNVLRSPAHVADARLVIRQMLGSLVVWVPPTSDYPESDRRGKEGITHQSTCALIVEIRPGGLCAGFLVAGGGFEPPTFGL